MNFASTRTLSTNIATVGTTATRPSVSVDAVLRLAGKGAVLFLCGAAPWVAILKIWALL